MRQAKQERMVGMFLTEPGVVVQRELPIPVPRPGEVLVQLRATGVCGSDVHYFRDGRIGRYVVREPLILGHETAGDVAAVGEGVTALRVGDRVALEPGIPCLQCAPCREGRYNLCESVSFMATPPVHGAFVEYVVHPAAFAFPLPDDVTYAEGAMAEPLAVGLQCISRLGDVLGCSVLVAGAGTIGQMAVLAARAAGAASVTVVDPVPYRLQVAREMGACEAVAPCDLDAGRLFDVSIEASGSQAAASLVMGQTRRGGRIVLVGLSTEGDVCIPVGSIVDNETDVLGVFRYANQYAKAIRLMASGVVKTLPLIGETFALRDVGAALAAADEHRDRCVKVLVLNSGKA